MSNLTPYQPPAPRQAGSSGLIPFTRDWRTAREFADAEIEHVRRSRQIEHEIAEEAQRQQAEAAFSGVAIANGNRLANMAQAGFAEFVTNRDAFIAEAKYQQTAEDILKFADGLASELGRLGANEVHRQKRH